jgi:hypothetical protein
MLGIPASLFDGIIGIGSGEYPVAVGYGLQFFHKSVFGIACQS